MLMAEVYYVSQTGNDENSGISSSEAWKTIKKATSVAFTGDDSLLFKGDDAFLGTLNIKKITDGNNSPLYIGSFGVAFF